MMKSFINHPNAATARNMKSSVNTPKILSKNKMPLRWIKREVELYHAVQRFILSNDIKYLDNFAKKYLYY